MSFFVFSIGSVFLTTSRRDQRMIDTMIVHVIVWFMAAWYNSAVMDVV
jgi:hypothetical protein